MIVRNDLLHDAVAIDICSNGTLASERVSFSRQVVLNEQKRATNALSKISKDHAWPPTFSQAIQAADPNVFAWPENLDPAQTDISASVKTVGVSISVLTAAPLPESVAFAAMDLKLWTTFPDIYEPRRNRNKVKAPPKN